MGLFNFIMKGMGFEGEQDTPKKEKKKKQAATSMIPQEKYSNFDSGLASAFSATTMKEGSVPQMPAFNNITTGKNMVIYAPRNNKDIQILVDCLRRQEACIINLGLLASNDAERILDFLSGAAYALKGSLKRLQGDLFLLTPEGVNVMTQAKN